MSALELAITRSSMVEKPQLLAKSLMLNIFPLSWCLLGSLVTYAIHRWFEFHTPENGFLFYHIVRLANFPDMLPF